MVSIFYSLLSLSSVHKTLINMSVNCKSEGKAAENSQRSRLLKLRLYYKQNHFWFILLKLTFLLPFLRLISITYFSIDLLFFYIGLGETMAQAVCF